MQRRRYGFPVKALEADDDQTAAPWLILAPRAVEVGLKPRADGLNEQARRCSGKREKPLEAQNAVCSNELAYFIEKAGAVGNCADRHHEAFKIIVIMFALSLKLVVRGPAVYIGFSFGADPQ